MVEDPTVPLLARSPNPNTPLTATSTTTFITSPGLDAPLQLSSSPTPSDDDDCEAEEADLNAARFRVWVFPARISDEEAEALMAAFPRYLKRPDARLPLARRRLKDLELASEPWHTLTVEGVAVSFPRVEAEDEAGVVRSGTGRMWVGTEERAPGWIGGRWFRFKRWWRRVFGRG
jgi:hypothetical protein